MPCVNDRSQRKNTVANRHGFALLRPVVDDASHEQVRDLVFHGYAEDTVTTTPHAFRRPSSVVGGRRRAMGADELLNVVDAAGYLGIRPWTLRHWICDRKIDVVKYGNGIVRIRRSVLTGMSQVVHQSESQSWTNHEGIATS